MSFLSEYNSLLRQIWPITVYDLYVHLCKNTKTVYQHRKRFIFVKYRSDIEDYLPVQESVERDPRISWR
jgi:hypothetical protein